VLYLYYVYFTNAYIYVSFLLRKKGVFMEPKKKEEQVAPYVKTDPFGDNLPVPPKGFYWNLKGDGGPSSSKLWILKKIPH
jgi:hypothetical protein